MKIYVEFVVMVDWKELREEIPIEILRQEFVLNWAEQVPHWDLWSDYGLKFFKDDSSFERRCENDKRN